MKKIIFLLSIVCSLFLTMPVQAASGSITASSSTRTAVVGSTFTVTVKVSCSDALGSWQFGLSYDNSYISLQSGDTNVASYGDGSSKTKTYTYKFKAIKAGTAGIRITGASMVSWNDENTLFTPSVSNASVTVKTQEEIEASYSKDNNLKSLTVSGFDLSPEFSRDTLEYSVEVPDDVTSIKVNASPNDGTASVRGTGTIDVSEGANRIEIVVTAQNGSTKKYVLNVAVKDLHPIDIEIENESYSVVKKAELLTNPVGYSPTVITIDEVEVPAFTSEITNFTLVGLKDEAGNIELYKYDKDKNEYQKYSEIKGIGLTLYPKNSQSLPAGFTTTKVTIDGLEYEAFVNPTYGNMTIIYAMNVESGYEGFYIYDKDEKSFIRYNVEAYDTVTNESDDFKFYTYALSAILVIFFLIIVICANKNRRLKRMLLKNAEKTVQKVEECVGEEVKNDNTENSEVESDLKDETNVASEHTPKKHKKKKNR